MVSNCKWIKIKSSNKEKGRVLKWKDLKHKINGITLIALVVTIIILLIVSGITINGLTGSNSTPDKVGETKQKRDIGVAQDQIGLMVLNAKTEAYVGTETTNSVGRTVIKAVAEQIQEKNQYDKATVEITGFGDLNNITNNATITISTMAYKVIGTIAIENGSLTWGEIEDNIQE